MSSLWIIHGVYITVISVLVYHINFYQTSPTETKYSTFNPTQTTGTNKPGTSNENAEDTTSMLQDNNIFLETLNNEGSSVWCSGNNNSNRICRFRNLCYIPKEQSFVFFHANHSVMVGVPDNRFDPALLDLSGVENHNSQYFNFVDVSSSASVDILTDVEIIWKQALIFNRFHPDNIMHVIHDDLLPLYTTLRMITGGKSLFDVQIFFADMHEDSEFSNLYDIFTTIPTLRRSELEHVPSNLRPNLSICFSDVIVGLSRHSTWYQYGFYEPQGPRNSSAVTSHDIKHFTKYVTSRIKLNPLQDTSYISDQEKDFIVLFKRTDNRKILNELDLCLALTKNFFMKVVTLSLETHSIAEIIHTVSRAMVVVGMHGSLLIFSIFLPPGAIIMELFPYGINPDHYTPYKTLAHIPGMNVVYRSWRNQDVSKTVTHPEWIPELGGILHLSDEQQREIQASPEVTPHLCCSHPEWLFRIYQDTIVNIDEISKLVDSALEERFKYVDESDKPRQERKTDSVYSKYPSLLGDVFCHCLCKGSESPKLQCQWQPPWNIKYLNMSWTVEYEIWVQELGANDYTSYTSSDPHFILTEGLACDTQYYIWISPIMNGARGQFTFRTCLTVES